MHAVLQILPDLGRKMGVRMLLAKRYDLAYLPTYACVQCNKARMRLERIMEKDIRRAKE